MTYGEDVLQAAEEHAAELKQLTGQLSHAAGESRRLQLHNTELQEASDHYQADNARLKVLLQYVLWHACHCHVVFETALTALTCPH